jgi:hypothetical protein
MNRAWRRAATLAGSAVLTLTLSLGCESKPSVDTTTTEATVKGKVTFEGEPVKSGEVRFDPSNYLRKGEVARRAPIGEDGTYTVKTLAGENRVTFAIPQIQKSPELQEMSLTFDAKAGENSYDLVLPPPSTSPTP